MWRYVLIAVAVLLTGCADGTSSMEAAVNPSGWESDQTVRVEYVNADTVSLREITLFAVVDGASAAEVRDALLEVVTESPDSLRYADTVPLRPAVASGDGRVWKRVFRSHALLSQQGRYGFCVTPLDKTPLKGIRAVGIEITNTEDGKR